MPPNKLTTKATYRGVELTSEMTDAAGIGVDDAAQFLGDAVKTVAKAKENDEKEEEPDSSPTPWMLIIPLVVGLAFLAWSFGLPKWLSHGERGRWSGWPSGDDRGWGGWPNNDR